MSHNVRREQIPLQEVRCRHKEGRTVLAINIRL